MHALMILAGDDNSGSGGSFLSFGILLLIPLAMYFLMIRPQRKRMREQQSMQSSLEVGDEVLTASGIYGFITAFEEDRIWIEIDDDVQIRVNRGFVQGKVDTSASAHAVGGRQCGHGVTRRTRALMARRPMPPRPTNDAPPPVGVAARLRRHHRPPADLQPRLPQHTGARARPAGRRVGGPGAGGGSVRRRPDRHP